MQKFYGIIGGVALCLIAGLAVLSGYLLANLKDTSLGSVAQSNEYNVTSTSFLSAVPAIVSFTTDSATLGSVVITGANTGIIDFYNATTTSKLLRTGQASTSTIHIASIPASLVAGTYTFDVKAPNGLLMVSSGLIPTSTITWR